MHPPSIINRIEEEEDQEKEPGMKINPKVLEKLIDQRTIMLAGPIDRTLADRIMSQLLALDGGDNHDPIRLFINSPGGDADAGFAMYDMIRFVKSPVIAISAGLCASAAVLVLMAAEKKNRVSLPNSRFLIHQPSTAIHGFVADIQIEANEIVKCRDRINKIISEATGQSVEKVAEDTRRNFWMSAEESEKYGLIAKVVSSKDDIG